MEYFSPEDIMEANPYVQPQPKVLVKKPVIAAPGVTSVPKVQPIQNPVTQAPAPVDPEGMMGYGKILRAMNSPEAWEAGLEAGTARSDASAQNMMKLGAPRQMAYGGRMSWAEALNNGLKQGIGMYDYMQSQKAKANALRKYQDIFSKLDAQQKEKEIFSPGRGSGQHSVQGNSDYEYDL